MKFSEYFKLDRTQAFLDFVDVPLHTDIPVFLEPVAIKCLESVWGNELSSLLQTFFETILRLIKEGHHENAQILLSKLNESNEFHLGYSRGKSRGHGFGPESAKNIWGALTKSSAAVTGLLKDLEDTALLLPGIGTDMISDALCNILRGPLIKYTQDMCVYYGIPLTPQVASGLTWNPQTEQWEDFYADLPMTDYGKVILVPKILVRLKLSFDANEYYRHYILPEMQHEHLQAKSQLVETLRNGNTRVTKKVLMAEYGKDKLAIVDQTRVRPQILEDYRLAKSRGVPKPLTLEQFAEIENETLPNLTEMLATLSKIDVGIKTATEYENIIERIFSMLFYPSLCSPTKQSKIHDGRKRIDIRYSNEAKDGFFYWLSLHYSCPFIYVECKNYGREIGNPELDQLAGRFSPSRGRVGILVCRSIENKELLYKRCVDAAKDGRGFILVLDDQDLAELVLEYTRSKRRQEFELLKAQWRRLVN
ncbi:hypothetical protein ACO0K9_26210 [Undibacterium sp. Ji50W]|uniref:hypothetical protein n=1 Tax=Undibacterium sp. Ji50W TaxID=3413041 RepID=UPI003BF0449E